MKNYQAFKANNKLNQEELLLKTYWQGILLLTLGSIIAFLGLLVIIWILGTLYMNLSVPLVQNTNENSVITK